MGHAPKRVPKKVLMQSLFRAGFRAFVAENAFCPIFTFAGFFVDLHVHRTYLQAFTAVDAFPLVAVNAQQGKIAHRLEKYCDRTQVFAERTVIPEHKGQRNARDIVKCVPHKEHPKHDFLQMRDLHQKQS